MTDLGLVDGRRGGARRGEARRRVSTAGPAQGASADRTAALRRRALRIARLAETLDRSVRLPVINRRIGLDGMIGLIPGVGDAIGGGLSLYIVAEAARAGARKRVLARMALNALVDSTLGAIPLVGDLFDFAFKANLRNAKLALTELRRLEATATAHA